MTELEAVNECLSAIRQRPVSSLDGTLDDDVALARQSVSAISRDVQTERQWWFNTLLGGTLTPSSGTIQLGAEILFAEWPPLSDIYTFRSGRLWKINQDGTETDVHTAAVSYSRLQTFRAFADLPHNAQRYISLRAARVFADRMLADGQPSRSASLEEVAARRALIREHMKVRRPNMLDAPQIRDTARRQMEGGVEWAE